MAFHSVQSIALNDPANTYLLMTLCIVWVEDFMNNCKKYALVAVMVMAAGFVYITGTHRNAPPDFRDAPGDGVD